MPRPIALASRLDLSCNVVAALFMGKGCADEHRMSWLPASVSRGDVGFLPLSYSRTFFSEGVDIFRESGVSTAHGDENDKSIPRPRIYLCKLKAERDMKPK